MWGRQLLHDGLRWKIGSGRQVSVHSSNWIQIHDFLRTDLCPNLPSDAVVADLINERQQWKEYIIAQHFSKDDVGRILRMTLPRTLQQDILIWRFDRHGNYSIKSGYQLAVKAKFTNNPSCSDSTKLQWAVIWSNEILKKVKVFMWRAAKNLLPTASNLWIRQIVLEPVCQRCGRKRKTC